MQGGLTTAFLALSAYISNGFINPATTFSTIQRNQVPRSTVTKTSYFKDDQDSYIELLNKAVSTIPALETLPEEEKLTVLETEEADIDATFKEFMKEDQYLRVYLAKKDTELSKMLKLSFEVELSKQIVTELGFQHWQNIFTNLAVLTDALTTSELPVDVAEYIQNSLETIYLVKTRFKRVVLDQKCVDQVCAWFDTMSKFYGALAKNGASLYQIEILAEEANFFGEQVRDSLK